MIAIEVGGIVLVAGRKVRVEAVKPDGSKVQVKGTWIAARVCTPLASAATARALDARQDHRDRLRTQRLLERVDRLISRLY